MEKIQQAHDHIQANHFSPGLILVYMNLTVICGNAANSGQSIATGTETVSGSALFKM